MKRFAPLFFLLLMFLLIAMSSCFRLKRFIYTDSELEEHYRHRTQKPEFKTIQFLGRAVHYALLSKNDTLPLLVFIHGAPGAWYGYMNMIDDSMLQNNFRMVSIDRPGYGKSGYGHAELSTQLQALAVKAIIDIENTSRKKVHLMGRSYGAPIAAWLAVNYPNETERLFMVSPVIDPTHEKFYWFSSIGKWKPVQWLLPKMLNVATKEKYAHVAEMKKMLPKWKNLFVPTYVLAGATDRIADTANFSFAKRHLSSTGNYFILLPNTGHLVTYQQADFVKQLLLGANKPLSNLNFLQE
jgi:pimeloyl-ACP methyl ester carboxylesterase